MTSSFSYLLEELGRIFRLPLQVDRIGACSIHFPKDFLMQLQLDSSEESLWLFTKLAPLPPGRFREDVLKEGLKANDARDPIPGILAYLEVTNQLILFQSYPVAILNGERLASLFGGFMEYGLAWRTAVLQGHSRPY